LLPWTSRDLRLLAAAAKHLYLWEALSVAAFRVPTERGKIIPAIRY